MGVRATADGRLAVAAPPEQIGEIAAANGVVLHELSVERATLEEVFLELTGEVGERGA
jgi:ABC-2 type transport system ATP-binding protein